MHRSSHSRNTSSGFPTPAQRPAFSGVMSSTHYTNMQAVPGGLSNSRVSELLPFGSHVPFARRLRDCVSSTGVLRDSDGKALGSGTLISANQFLVAKHSLEGRQPADICVHLGYLGSGALRGEIYRVKSVREDPNTDLALLTLEVASHASRQPATLSMEEQPAGRHFILHHAGGLPMQVSTGEFVDHGGMYSFQHQLLIDAGPIASGAGVRNSDGHLIGVCIARTTANGAIAREVVLLSQSQLFSQASFGTPFAQFRPSGHLGTDPLYSDALEGRIPREELLRMTEAQARAADAWQEWKDLRRHTERKLTAQALQTAQASAQQMTVSNDTPLVTAAFHHKHERDLNQGSLKQQVQSTAQRRQNQTHLSSVIATPLARQQVVPAIQTAAAQLTQGDFAVDWNNQRPDGTPAVNVRHGTRLELPGHQVRTQETRPTHGQPPAQRGGPHTLQAALTLDNGNLVIPHVEFQPERNSSVNFDALLKRRGGKGGLK